MADGKCNTKKDRREQTQKVIISVLSLCIIQGCVITILSSWIASRRMDCSHTEIYNVGSYLCIVTGLVTIIASTVGLIKLRQSYSYELIMLFSLSSFGIVALHASVAIISQVHKNHIKHLKLYNTLRQDMEDISVSSQSEKCWNSLQTGYHCCGLHDLTEWANVSITEDFVRVPYDKLHLHGSVSNTTHFSVPESCLCTHEHLDNGRRCIEDSSSTQSVTVTPCYPLYEEGTLKNLDILRIFSPVLLSFQVLQCIVTLILIMKINKFRSVDQTYAIS